MIPDHDTNRLANKPDNQKSVTNRQTDRHECVSGGYHHQQHNNKETIKMTMQTKIPEMQNVQTFNHWTRTTFAVQTSQGSGCRKKI